MDFRTLRLQSDGAVARITLARPGSANRVDTRLLRELSVICESIAANEAICSVLLTAEGADFCAGWDASLSSLPADESTRDATEAETLLLDPFGPLVNLSIPVIAALHGATYSAGLELALACDIRVAAEDARFALPEVSQGTLPRAGGSQRLPRVVGPAIATSMLLLGDELDANAAYRAGLVSRVVPANRLGAEAEALARRIAAHGPLALRYAKEAVHQGAQLPLDQALRYELDLSVILQTTRDRAEGVQAFLEKRPPGFDGH